MARVGPITAKSLAEKTILSEATIDRGIEMLLSTLHFFTTYSHSIWATSSLIHSATSRIPLIGSISSFIRTSSLTQNNANADAELFRQNLLPEMIKPYVTCYKSLAFSHWILSWGAWITRLPFPAWKGAVQVIGPYAPGGISGIERGLAFYRLVAMSKFSFLKFK